MNTFVTSIEKLKSEMPIDENLKATVTLKAAFEKTLFRLYSTRIVLIAVA